MRLILLAFCFDFSRTEYCSNDSCKDEDIDPFSFELTRIDGVHTGWKEDIVLADGRKTRRTTLSMAPLLFEIDDFLTSDECDHIIKESQRIGFKSGETGRSIEPPLKEFKIYDFDKNDKIDLDEMQLMLQHNYDMYFTPADIKKMYQDLSMDKDGDGYISKKELDSADLTVLNWREYLYYVTSKKPWLKDRHSDVSWIHPEKGNDKIIRKIVERVGAVAELPMVMMNRSDLQVVYYTTKGHYNVHMDSTNGVMCCDRFAKRKLDACYPCRWMTILFYLNDVPKGGETAFPFADQADFNEDIYQRKHYFDLNLHCDKSKLLVRPKKGRAVIWYNHFPGRGGWFGKVDHASYHGSCPVLVGEKWVANFWITVHEDKFWNLTPLTDVEMSLKYDKDGYNFNY